MRVVSPLFPEYIKLSKTEKIEWDNRSVICIVIFPHIYIWIPCMWGIRLSEAYCPLLYDHESDGGVVCIRDLKNNTNISHKE